MSPIPLNTVDDTVQALVQSFTMIIVSEIGDKTFLIAAILAMRHPRLTVFMGAFGSLVVMSILSAAMGHLLPTLIPLSWTRFAASVLFLSFGVKMLVEARGMKDGSQKIQDEMREAEEEIKEDEGLGGDDDEIPLEDLEEGRAGIGKASIRPSSPSSSSAAAAVAAVDQTKWSEGARNFCNLFLGPVFVQAFVLTFLGEWGDRSQISTIALGAAHNVYLVTLGTVVGHSLCTALAVIGGRYISTKISAKHLTYGGSTLFLLFGIIYLYGAFTANIISLS